MFFAGQATAFMKIKIALDFTSEFTKHQNEEFNYHDAVVIFNQDDDIEIELHNMSVMICEDTFIIYYQISLKSSRNLVLGVIKSLA